MKGQNKVFNNLTADKFYIGNSSKIDEIVTSIAGVTPANDQIPTVKAVTDYVTAGGAVTNFVELSAGEGTDTALATAGIDLASGTDATYYAKFFAPTNITAIKLHILLTEAYVKDTTDAIVAVKDNATTPATIFTSTLAEDGVDAGTHIIVAPSKGAAAINAGTRLDVAITATGSSSGTGHVKIILEYTV